MFSVFKVKADGSSVAVQGWTDTPAVSKEGWNVLKVEAAGNHFRFYINGTLVWEGSRSGLSTGRVGISMYTDPASTGEDFRVDWARPDALQHPGSRVGAAGAGRCGGARRRRGSLSRSLRRARGPRSGCGGR